MTMGNSGLKGLKKKTCKKYKHEICKIGTYIDSYCTYIRNFYPLKVVDHGGETQLQVRKIVIV